MKASDSKKNDNFENDMMDLLEDFSDDDLEEVLRLAELQARKQHEEKPEVVAAAMTFAGFTVTSFSDSHQTSFRQTVADGAGISLEAVTIDAIAASPSITTTAGSRPVPRCRWRPPAAPWTWSPSSRT